MQLTQRTSKGDDTGIKPIVLTNRYNPENAGLHGKKLKKQTSVMPPPTQRILGSKDNRSQL